MENTITLDEITEWARANEFTYVGGQRELYIGSDGEEMYEDEMIEIIEEDKKPLRTLINSLTGGRDKKTK